MRHVDLCSGIGGFALGFQWAELSQPVLFCDVDHFARLYEDNVLVEERHDCEPGSWDISLIDQPQYGSRLETNDAHR